MLKPRTSTTTHLMKLSVEIGARPIGTPANHAAAAYIQDVFTASGLEVELQEYECTAWEDLGASLTLGGQALEACTNAFSPPCDVTAALAPVGTVAELECADLEGRIAVLYGDLAKEPLACKSWFLKSERDDHIIQLLEEGRPVALLSAQTRAGMLERLIEDWELLIPSASVPAGAGLALVRQPGAPAHLRIDSRRAPGRTANVVARRAGESAQKIVLMAHYDTKIDTPGAGDNASGVAVLLGLAERLSRLQLHYGLEFVAFTGEEYLPIGDFEYLQRGGEQQMGQILAAANFDGVGPWLAPSSITLISGSQPFQEHLSQITRRYPAVVWVEPWPQSNHSTFSWRGVPSIAFSSVGGFRTAHLRSDTVDWINPARLDELVDLVAEIVESVQDKTLEWARPST